MPTVQVPDNELLQKKWQHIIKRLSFELSHAVTDHLFCDIESFM